MGRKTETYPLVSFDLVWFFLRFGVGILHSIEKATQLVHGTPRLAASQRTYPWSGVISELVRPSTITRRRPGTGQDWGHPSEWGQVVTRRKRGIDSLFEHGMSSQAQENNMLAKQKSYRSRCGCIVFVLARGALPATGE